MAELRKAIMVVFTEATGPEDEAEFNDWYDNTHLADVLKTPGFVAATRYKLSEAQPSGSNPGTNKYLSIYEIEAPDIQAALDALVAGRPNRYLSPTLAIDKTQAPVYDLITQRVTR
jgi:hypothetical protein